MADLDIIKQLTEESGIKLERLSQIIWTDNGYTLGKDKHVVSFSFFSYRPKNFEFLFCKLKNLNYLTELWLEATDFSETS